MTRSFVDRRHAETKGRLSEIYAACFLRLNGFSILQRRYRTKTGEIDIIARRRKLIVYAEVKARQTINEAIDAVTRRNRRRITEAVGQFLARHPHLANYDMRYDIIAIAGWQLRHIPGAWTDGD